MPLMSYLELIERSTGRRAITEPMAAQPGDVPDTCANLEPLRNDLGIRDFVPVEQGVDRFVKWFRGVYGL